VSTKISQQADDYEESSGESFSMPLAIRDRDKKNPSKLRFCADFVLLLNSPILESKQVLSFSCADFVLL
jgi:hypothetical protein